MFIFVSTLHWRFFSAFVNFYSRYWIVRCLYPKKKVFVMTVQTMVHTFNVRALNFMRKLKQEADKLWSEIKILTAILMVIKVLWDEGPWCWLINSCGLFKGAHCLHLKNQANSEDEGNTLFWNVHNALPVETPLTSQATVKLKSLTSKNEMNGIIWTMRGMKGAYTSER